MTAPRRFFMSGALVGITARPVAHLKPYANSPGDIIPARRLTRGFWREHCQRATLAKASRRKKEAGNAESAARETPGSGSPRTDGGLFLRALRKDQPAGLLNKMILTITIISAVCALALAIWIYRDYWIYKRELRRMREAADQKRLHNGFFGDGNGEQTISPHKNRTAKLP